MSRNTSMISPSPPGASLHQLFNQRLSEKSRVDSTLTPPDKSATKETIDGSASPSVWSPVIKVAINLALCVGIGIISSRLLARTSTNTDSATDTDSNANTNTNSTTTTTAITTDSSTNADSNTITNEIFRNAAIADNDQRNSESSHSENKNNSINQNLTKNPLSLSIKQDNEENDAPSEVTTLTQEQLKHVNPAIPNSSQNQSKNATNTDEEDESTESQIEEANNIDEGDGPTRVAYLFVYPLQGCPGVEVPSVNLSSNGLTAEGLPRFNFVITNFTGKILNPDDFPMLQNVSMNILPNGDIGLSLNEEIKSIEFTPSTKEILYGKSGKRKFATRIKINGKMTKVLDQGDDASLFFAQVTELGGVRLMHVLPESKEEEKVKKEASDILLCIKTKEEEMDAVIRNQKPLIVLDVKDSDTLEELKEQDILHIGVSRLKVVSSTSSSSSRTSRFVHTVVMDGDKQTIMSVGDITKPTDN